MTKKKSFALHGLYVNGQGFARFLKKFRSESKHKYFSCHPPPLHPPPFFFFKCQNFNGSSNCKHFNICGILCWEQLLYNSAISTCSFMFLSPEVQYKHSRNREEFILKIHSSSHFQLFSNNLSQRAEHEVFPFCWNQGT